MTDKMKKTIEMIRYGEQQMNRKEFFEGLQRISAEESDELHKIVVDDQIVKPADEEEEDEE